MMTVRSAYPTTTVSTPRWMLSLLSMIVLIGLFTPTTLAVQSCNGSNEEMLEFRFFTDAHSWSDNGWTLVCTDISTGIEETIWNVPVGSISYEESTKMVRFSDCIPSTFMCTFTLEDFGADGLYIEGENGLAGWYSLIYGSTTIDTYDGEELFTQKTYCIGSGCDQLPQEIASPSSDGCQHATMAMQLDNFPNDTTYSLVCGDNNDVMWSGANFTTPGQQINEDICISNAVCCTFTVTDTNTLGMTDPYVDETGQERYGSVYLEWNEEGVVEYDGVTGEEFDVLTVQFGYGCAGTTQGPDGTTTTAAPGSNTTDTNGDVVDESGNDSGDAGDEGDGSVVVPDDFGGEIPVVGGAQSESNKGGGLSHGAMVALITLAGLAMFASLAVALFYTKAQKSMEMKDTEIDTDTEIL